MLLFIYLLFFKIFFLFIFMFNIVVNLYLTTVRIISCEFLRTYIVSTCDNSTQIINHFVVLGEKIKEGRWKHMQELFRMRSKAFSMAGGLLNQIPWCRFFIPNLSGYTLISNLNRQISDIIEVSIPNLC